MTFGIDVSHYQGVIDWKRAHADGVDFAFAKATEGTGFTDPRFAGNLAGMRAAGVLPGAYHFLRPGNPAAQADRFNRAVGDPTGVLVALDVEARGLTRADVAGWVARYKQLHPGHPVIIYTGRDLWGSKGNGSGFGPCWAAGIRPNGYSSSAGYGLARSWAAARAGFKFPPFAGWTSPVIVQWTDNCRVAGVPSPCDANHTDLTVTDLRRFTDSGVVAPPPAHEPGTNVPPAAPAWPLKRTQHFGPRLPLWDLSSVSGYYPPNKGKLAPWQAQMARRGWRIAVTGVYDDQTAKVAGQFRAEKKLGPGNRIGPVTWAAAWTAPVTK